MNRAGFARGLAPQRAYQSEIESRRVEGHVELAAAFDETAAFAQPFRNAKSTSGLRPETISASAFPEPAAIVHPSVPWPALMYRLG
jgi:hypothetical protein